MTYGIQPTRTMGYSTLGTGPNGESEFTKGKTTGPSGTTRGLSGETGGESCQNDRVEGTAPDKPKTPPKPRVLESHFAKYYEYYLHRSLGNKTSLGDDLKNFVKRITGQQTVDKKAEQAALAKEVLDDLMADKRDSFIRELRVRSPENLEKLKQRWAPESELDPYDFFLEYFHSGEITTCLASDYDITQPVLDQRLRDELRLALDEWRKNPLPPLEPEELEGFKGTGNEEKLNQNNIMQEVLGDELILRNTISNHPKTGPEGDPDCNPGIKNDKREPNKNQTKNKQDGDRGYHQENMLDNFSLKNVNINESKININEANELSDNENSHLNLNSLHQITTKDLDEIIDKE